MILLSSQQSLHWSLQVKSGLKSIISASYSDFVVKVLSFARCSREYEPDLVLRVRARLRRNCDTVAASAVGKHLQIVRTHEHCLDFHLSSRGRWQVHVSTTQDTLLHHPNLFELNSG